MTGDRSERAGERQCDTPSDEIDALGTVIAATAAMAERVRSGAASELLRRALVLIQERAGARPEDEDRDRPAQDPDGFRRP